MADWHGCQGVLTQAFLLYYSIETVKMRLILAEIQNESFARDGCTTKNG